MGLHYFPGDVTNSEAFLPRIARDTYLITKQSKWLSEVQYDVFLEFLLHWALLGDIVGGLLWGQIIGEIGYMWISTDVQENYNVTATSPSQGSLHPVTCHQGALKAQLQCPSPGLPWRGHLNFRTETCDVPCWVCTVAPLFPFLHAASSPCPAGVYGTFPNKLCVCNFRLRICFPRSPTCNRHTHADTHRFLGALLSYFQAVVSNDAEERDNRVQNG